MKKYSSISIIVTVCSILLFISCKKDVPAFRDANNNNNSPVLNVTAANPANIGGSVSMAKPIGFIPPDTLRKGR